MLKYAKVIMLLAACSVVLSMTASALASEVTSANQDVNSRAVTLTLIDASGKEHSISVPTDAVTKTVVVQSNPNTLLRFPSAARASTAR